MRKFLVVRNTETGKTISNEPRFGESVNDSFLDSYEQELVVCHAIIDKMHIIPSNHITVTFDKNFLHKILHSHISVTRRIANV